MKPREPSYTKMRMEMLCSPSWAALTPAAKRVIERLMIENMRHAGKNNGQLICTYSDFAAFGIRYPSIGPAIQQAVQLGFVVITQHGRRSPDHSWPSRYRLTFLPTSDAGPTDEWMRFDQQQSAAKKTTKMQKPGYENVACTAYKNVACTAYENVAPGHPKDRLRKRSTFIDATHLRSVATRNGGKAQ